MEISRLTRFFSCINICCLMKFTFSFNNQYFPRNILRPQRWSKPVFADWFKISHISSDSLKTDYNISFGFFWGHILLCNQSPSESDVWTPSLKKRLCSCKKRQQWGRNKRAERKHYLGFKSGKASDPEEQICIGINKDGCGLCLPKLLFCRVACMTGRQVCLISEDSRMEGEENITCNICLGIYF